ncbi:hypothetical protein DYI95_005635 [Thermaerobacter sp. PB12/4term]|uniref:hypothetical protein n=1 Tax=Thermaerobacter sp. PB12/4term TaxID=2293838 RepID=UPI000E32A63F|nr:hypothetical protein [Thermaerobacter sp. PB12/4term]QIA27069.1 hypothetical protein DYI95_005635 [Thermaerobacter sp. PB12/4term]
MAGAAGSGWLPGSAGAPVVPEGLQGRLLVALTGLALATSLLIMLLRRPVLPVRLRGRWHHGRLTLALQVGWSWLAFRYRLGWRPPGPLQLRRSLRLPPVLPRRRVVLYRRRLMPRPAWPWPLPEATPARQFVRLVTAGRWQLRRLMVKARAGLADAAQTAWLAGTLWALAAAASAAAAGAAPRRAASPPDIRVEPAFGRPEWALDLDCIALVAPWEAMSAARALLGARRRARPAGPGARAAGPGAGAPGPAEGPGPGTTPVPPRPQGAPAPAQAGSSAARGAPAILPGSLGR